MSTVKDNAPRGMGQRKPTREAFSLSREAEYLTELSKQIGYEPDLYLLATVKELVDNALDHCEEIGRLPSIAITFGDNALTVTDNGDGIPPEVVKSMLDFTTKTSSRAAYRCPTRGAMGNAGKCIIAVPYCLSGDARQGRASITGQGIRHAIDVRLDSLTNVPKLDCSHEPVEVQNGTIVELDLPELPRILGETDLARFVLFGRNTALLNPHLDMVLVMPDGERYEWSRSTETCPKWTAAEPDPPGWHDLESFERLTGATIAKCQASGTDPPLNDYVSRFAGLKRSDARKAVAAETGLTRACMSDLLDGEDLDHAKTESLLKAMQRHGKTPRPEKLGCIGRHHLEGFLSSPAVIGAPKYKKLVGETTKGLPFVVEAAFVETNDGTRSIVTGCNFSASIDRPVVRVFDYLLERQRVDAGASATLVLHVSIVAPTFLDRGKTILSPDAALAQAIEKVVVQVTDEYCKRRNREERDAAAHERRLKRQSRGRPDCSLKEAIEGVLLEGIREASGGGQCDCSGRDAFYAVRKLIQDHTDGKLTQKYFDKVVKDWECEHGLIEGLQRDPRGFLLEPHTGERVPLGTKAIDDYEIPLHLYDTLLFFEKKGVLSKLQLGKIGERFDCGIIAAEGYAVRAAKALIQAAQKGHKMKVLCFHDADPAGYNIARTLSRSTGAHRYNIKVIDAGLHLQEGLDMGLAVETFERKNALPKGLVLDDTELEYFTGEARPILGKSGKPKTHWVRCRRIELNALSADPQAFIAWVESKLREHGVAQKLVPPKKVIAARANAQRQSQLRQHVETSLKAALDLDATIDAITKQLARQVDIDGTGKAVATWAKSSPPEPWTKCVDHHVSRAIAKLDKQVQKLVNEAAE